MLDGLQDYVPLVGLNSSGKSNILRAMNLFFNGRVDEGGEELDLAVDYSNFAPKRKKKEVSVTVGISLGPNMRVRGQDEFQVVHGISDIIYVRKTWSLGFDKLSLTETVSFGPSLDTIRPASQDELASVLTHIRAIRFIYIPNHTRPADLIRTELAPLRPTLVARLRSSRAYRDASVSDLLAELGRMGDRMFGDVSIALRRGLPTTTVSADLPSDFADLVFTVGVRAVSDADVARTPEYEGSGAQSFMLLHILDLADRTQRSGGFGWVQASVWAMEEPESFLHSGLRAQFSGDLRSYADDERRQVFTTTHQDEFVRVADAAWITSKAADGTGVASMSAKEALIETTRRSVTAFRHPLFAYPDVPIVIVEGKFDDIYIRSALEEISLRPRWKVLAPDTALAVGTGGDALYQYLKYNQQVIQSRPNSAPVLVLRDWEATDKSKYDSVLAVHPYSRCLVAPASKVNPELDEEFVGIERYLPTTLIARVIPASKLGKESTLPGARYTIKKKVYFSFKQALADAVAAGESAGVHMNDLVRWIDSEVVLALDAVPVSDFH
jgi:AAA domain, putative AbiEii toxin, Type IV TA system